MKRIVITGFSGFVASYFIDYLYNNHPDYDVYGISRGLPNYDYEHYKDKMKVSFYKLNLMESEELIRLFDEIKPDYVLHLASVTAK